MEFNKNAHLISRWNFLYACLHYQVLQLQDHEKVESFRHALHFSAVY